MTSNLHVRAEFLLANLDLEEVTGIEGARLEPFQLMQLSSDDLFSIYNKSRQIAFSFTEAAKAVARALLVDESTVFVSINLQEAHEKIVYTQRIYEALSRKVKVEKLKSETKLGLTFASGARIISHPSKAPRGKSRFHIVLDEYAHIPSADAQKIYSGSVPILSKGGTLTIGSSPLDANGPFWEIFTESFKPYEQFKRYRIPWYLSFWFCLDPRKAFESKQAGMSDAQIVEKYGNERIKVIFESLVLEDFLVEYCCSFADGSTSWITASETLACINNEFHPVTFELNGNEPGKVDLFHAELLEILSSDPVFTGNNTIVGAMDIGRRRDATEIVLLRLTVNSNREPSFTPILFITLHNCPFEQQWSILDPILRRLNGLRKFFIDSTGLGMSIGEKATTTYPLKAEAKTFTVANKIEWAVAARKAFQQKAIVLPYDKELIYQVQSIKRRVSASNNVLFDAERTEKGHADKFWALSMALTAGYEASEFVEFAINTGSYAIATNRNQGGRLLRIPQDQRTIAVPRRIHVGSQIQGMAPLIGLKQR